MTGERGTVAPGDSATATVFVAVPPQGFEFEWRGVNFKPEEKTLVTVRFEPSRQGTLVSVCHRGWSALPADHPARHGQTGADFSRMIGLWWGEQLTSLREHVKGGLPPPRD